jgi:hypothetical protein
MEATPDIKATYGQGATQHKETKRKLYGQEGLDWA